MFFLLRKTLQIKKINTWDVILDPSGQLLDWEKKLWLAGLTYKKIEWNNLYWSHTLYRKEFPFLSFSTTTITINPKDNEIKWIPPRWCDMMITFSWSMFLECYWTRKVIGLWWLNWWLYRWCLEKLSVHDSMVEQVMSYIYIIYILLKLKIIIENKNNKVYRNFDRVFSQIFLPIEVTIYLHIANTI